LKSHNGSSGSSDDRLASSINRCNTLGKFISTDYCERIALGGFMDILAALRQEEAKFEKQVNVAQQQLDNVRAAMKLLGGMCSGGKATGSSSAKTTGGKKRVMSAAARARISKASKERWAKLRAAKAKGKQ
jgi:hypothetical protein